MLVSPINAISSSTYEIGVNKSPNKKFVTVDIQPQLLTPEEAVDSLASIEGELDVYTWYEGPTIITRVGAKFLKERLFEPLYKRKSDAKILLYCLEAWNCQRNVSAMKETTTKGNLINSINNIFVECVYASSFFKFCTNYNRETPLYRFVSQALESEGKEWLKELSANRKPKGKTIGELFEQQPSLVDCIKNWDVSNSYSILQYLEGYYLIREAVKKGLEQKKQKVQVAFVLPNDEAKYYRDLPEDLQNMLKAEFGETLNELEINVYFKFYEYGSSTSSRPYLGPMKRGLNIRDDEVKKYFDYLPANQKV